MRFDPHHIPDEAIEALRPAFTRFGLEGEYHTPEYWVQRCRDGSAQLWRSDDGAYWAVTEVFDTARGRVLHEVASAGAYRKSLFDEGEAWARSVGCTKARTEGRPGWKKRLPDYKVVAMTFEKEL